MRENQDAFDILKVILSIFVILIHTELMPAIVYPWVDLAVPLFFMISSYFFFLKLKNTSSEKIVLLNFLKRNMILYVFWFIILFPITFVLRGWHKLNIWECIINIIWRFLFNGTFRASWYIVALCIGVVIVYCLGKHIGNRTIILITGCVYFICCLFTRYTFFMDNFPVIFSTYQWYTKVFLSVGNSYPVALLWVALGKYFAECSRYKISVKLHMCTIASSILILVEHCILLYFKLPYTGCNFLIIPLCVCVFIYTYNSRVKCKYSVSMRRLSTITYCLHASIVTIIAMLLRNCGIVDLQSQIINTLLTIVICYIAGFVIIKLERYRYFKWLSMSH